MLAVCMYIQQRIIATLTTSIKKFLVWSSGTAFGSELRGPWFNSLPCHFFKFVIFCLESVLFAVFIFKSNGIVLKWILQPHFAAIIAVSCTFQIVFSLFFAPLLHHFLLKMRHMARERRRDVSAPVGRAPQNCARQETNDWKILYV